MATTAKNPPAASPSSAGRRATSVPTLNLQRIPVSIDPFGKAGTAIASTLEPFRLNSITHVYLGIEQLSWKLNTLTLLLNQPTIPNQIVGVLVQPDGAAAYSLQVEFNPSSAGSNSQPVTALTAGDGSFQLTVPSGIFVPPTGITLRVHGANGNVQVVIPGDRVATNGLVGTFTLPSQLSPLPVSILASLNGIMAGSGPAANPPAPANPPQLPTIQLGEADGCMLSFGANNTVDSFPYGVFFRLVEPRLSIVQQIGRHSIGDDSAFLPLPVYLTPDSGTASGETGYVDRVPVEQPLSADGFRDQLMGLDPFGQTIPDETVPMAATLGLGYVLWMSQQWTFQGVGLGDLVYSLPLAPGEQQEVAIYERIDTAAVTETEFLSEEQAEQQSALADTSTQSTFDSAFSEAASGGSAFQTRSSTSSWGASILIASGGGGSSNSSGTSSSWLQGQRDSAEQAAQSTHSAAENQASARRSAARTSMRMASATESESVTTKTITNHNHAHALTMQYWEVQRLYDVTTAIDGLTLACLVPMQVVRFLPPNQPLMITDPSCLSNAGQVSNRYGAIIKHLDVLARAIPAAYQHGLVLLQQFASDPAMTVEPAGGVAEDVIQFNLTGTFVPCEDIYISAVTDRNTRVGPVQLANNVKLQTSNGYASRDELLADLGRIRQEVNIKFTGALALPPSINRSNIIGFEISRNFRQLDYTLVSPEMAELSALQGIFGSSADWAAAAIQSTLGADRMANERTTVHLTPKDLETVLGGPRLTNFYAYIQEFDATGNPTGTTTSPTKGETYANDSLNGVELPPQPYPVPALQLAPVLRYNDVLDIERMAQHVVRNTMLYSKAVWASLSAEERAILLDQYTIGVSPGGITDESQMIPLLNCVQNRLLGFFGNSMVLPFMIPPAVMEAMHPDTAATRGDSPSSLDPTQIQQSLLAYQQATFSAPRSTIALPTRGVLGEAVLGHCSSAEKIDLRRFWNWQDSASDAAPVISPTGLPTGSANTAAGLTAPNTLTGLPSLINNVLTAPAPDTSLLQALSKAGASQQDFNAALTGAPELAGLLTNAQNISNAARADALKTTKDLQAQAMATVGNIAGGIMGGNPTAGSSAAAAVEGGGGGSDGSAQSATGGAGPGKPATPSAGAASAGGTTS